MAPNLTSGVFNFESLLGGGIPVGVTSIILPASQAVHVQAPVGTVWQIPVSTQSARLTSSTVVGSQVERQPSHVHIDSVWANIAS